MSIVDRYSKRALTSISDQEEHGLHLVVIAMTHAHDRSPGGAKSAWIVRFKPQSAPRLRLLVLPHAGSGVAAYRPWCERLAPFAEMNVVLLPGREGRLGEPAITRVEQLISTLVQEVRPLLDEPFAVLGHSMGSLLAFELARELRRRGLPQPRKLYVSGRRAPMVGSQEPMLHTLPEDIFLERLRQRYDGIPKAILDEPEILRLLLPILRADFELLETYTFRPEEPLDCPITVYGGQDDPQTRPGELEAWREFTRAHFGVHWFSGGHFYLFDRQSPFLASFSSDLGRLGE